ncbi:MAG: QueT transporter family protein [Clostridia bacterium]|nr:QueT transporter family protein [Clostridia bacterium]
MKMTKTKAVVFTGMVAAIYAVLSLMPGISVLTFGPVQLRIAEALNALALLTPWAIPGLTIGCFVTNLASPMMAVDIVFGTLATLIASLLTYLLRKKPVPALLMPVISNGLIIGAVISIFTESGFGLFANMVLVAAGEAAACYIFGLPLYKSLKRFFTEI